MGLTLDVPDHTTLSRRTAGLDVRLKHRDHSRPLDLVIDATGVGVFGEGEWAAAKWGGRGKRGWKKLHLAVDQDGVIVAVELTDNNVADALRRAPPGGPARRTIGSSPQMVRTTGTLCTRPFTTVEPAR